MKLVMIGGVCACLATACASTPIPADKLARSAAAVKSAEVANADQVPQARDYLKSARSELDHAKRLLQSGDNKAASFVLLRSEADAEAALNLAHESEAQKDAMQTIQSVQAIKAQLEVPKS
jgi:hypothetical protein